jgi:hypothetical protein
MVDSFIDQGRSGGGVRPPSEDGLAQLRVLDAVLAAARAG